MDYGIRSSGFVVFGYVWVIVLGLWVLLFMLLRLYIRKCVRVMGVCVLGLIMVWQ